LNHGRTAEELGEVAPEKWRRSNRDQALRIPVGPPEASLSALVFSPERPEPRATILLLHGIYDQKMTMVNLGHALAERAFGWWRSRVSARCARSGLTTSGNRRGACSFRRAISTAALREQVRWLASTRRSAMSPPHSRELTRMSCCCTAPTTPTSRQVTRSETT